MGVGFLSSDSATMSNAICTIASRGEKGTIIVVGSSRCISGLCTVSATEIRIVHGACRNVGVPTGTIEMGRDRGNICIMSNGGIQFQGTGICCVSGR